MSQIQRVKEVNLQVNSANKVWWQIKREGITGCTVERMIARLGLEGSQHGKVAKTTSRISLPHAC